MRQLLSPIFSPPTDTMTEISGQENQPRKCKSALPY